MYTLSIIIPVYNVEQYIEECLNSIIGFSDIEIIIINDCSPDNSMQIVKSYTEKYSNFIIIEHEENSGLGKTRNTGLKYATGKYVMFLDSDDYLQSELLPDLLQTLKETESEQVLISYKRFDESQRDWPLEFKSFYETFDTNYLNHKNFTELIHIVNLSQLRIIKRKKILDDSIQFPDGIYEDILWSYWFAYSCTETLIINNRIYMYRQRPKSILSSISSRHMDLIDQYNLTISFFEQKNVPQSYIDIIKYKFFTHSNFLLFNSNRLPDNLKYVFYKKTILSLKPFTYILKGRNSLSMILKSFFFLNFGFNNNKNYHEIKFIFSKSGIKKSISLLLYTLLKLIPTTKKIWVFGSRFDKFTDNTKYFYLLNLENSKKDKIKFIWISNQEHTVDEINKLGGTAYKKNSLKGIVFSILSKYKLINCWSDDIGFLHTSNGVIVNFWHGLPLKAIEYDIKKGPQAKSYVNAFSKIKYRLPLLRKNDIVFNSSEYFESKFKSSLRPTNLSNSGSPRLDILKMNQNSVLDFLRVYNFSETLNFIKSLKSYNKVYIYMPTFRDSSSSWSNEIKSSFSFINKYLKENNECMIFKVHQNDEALHTIALGHSHILLYNLDDAYPILPFTDCLISDYSSIIFDYLVLKKPIILFPFDKDEYISESRELYFNYDEIFKEIEQPKNAVSLINSMQNSSTTKTYPNLIDQLGNIHIELKCSEKIYTLLKSF